MEWWIPLGYAMGAAFAWWAGDRFDEWRARRRYEREAAMRNVTPR